MLRKIAIKKLSQSDLTIFEWHFRNQPAGNQKAINLNADIFISKLYPILPDLSSERNSRIPLDLHIYGPGTNRLHNLQRKIIKGGNYKNWRLNGEFIYNPSDSPERYNTLVPGDLAIIEFYGVEVPTSSKIILLSSTQEQDRVLCRKFDSLLGQRTMIEIGSYEFNIIVTEANVALNHPILELTTEADIEEAIYMGDFDVEAIKRKPSLRNISKEDFENAKRSAEDSGRRGEEIVNEYLDSEVLSGKIVSFKWVSSESPLYPYDFILNSSIASKVYVDVKSTTGEFERKFFISFNELKQMATVSKYDIYRVYEIDINKAKLRISENLGSFANSILNILSKLPAGVLPSGICVSPKAMDFNDEVYIKL